MSSQVLPLTAVGAKVISREILTRVSVDESLSGKEARSSWWNAPKYRYRIGVDVTRADTRLDYQQFLSHFVRHFGQFDSYLLKDEEDYTVTAHGFGVGDGATLTFQLQRSQLGTMIERGTGGPYAVSSKPRTNLCLQSQTFDNATWTKTRSSVSANAAIAPDGTMTADKLVEDATATSTHFARQSVTLAASTTYTHSVWAKASTRTGIFIDISGVATGSYDLSAGTCSIGGAGATGAITSCVSGWYRCELTVSSGAGGATNIDVYLTSGGTSSYSGDGASGLFLWGAQVEAASASTKYIPTTAAALTSTPSYWVSGGSQGYSDGFEPVDEPDLASLLVYKDGTLKTLTTDYTVSVNGLVTFVVAPTAAMVLTWTGTYYRRVRFESAGMVQERLVSRMWALPTLDFVSVRSIT